MDKIIFEKAFGKLLDKNFETYSQYFDFDLKVFFELTTTIFEINKCLILDLHKAAITLTNNLLERLFKLALINNEVGLGSIPVEKWDSVFSETDKLFGSLNMAETINLCKKKNLITYVEKDFLNETIRDQIRNGFSHADSSKILGNVSGKSIGFIGNLNGQLDFKQVEFNQKIFPASQSFLIDDFAKTNASSYFEFVFSLLVKIEDRLLETERH